MNIESQSWSLFMQSQAGQSERRKYQRYDVKNLTIAVPNKSTPPVGRIVNISRGGMAVRYLDHDEWLGDARTIDILINSHFFLTKLPVQNVNDFKVENQISFSIMSERQCCLQFGPLSSEQEQLLDEFIVQHTIGRT